MRKIERSRSKLIAASTDDIYLSDINVYNNMKKFHVNEGKTNS